MKLGIREVYTCMLFVAAGIVTVISNWDSIHVALCVDGYAFVIGLYLCVDATVKLYKLDHD